MRLCCKKVLLLSRTARGHSVLAPFLLLNGLEVAEPPVAAAVFDAAKPCARWVEGENDGDPNDIDNGQGVSPVIEVADKDDVGADQEAPVWANGCGHSQGKGVDEEDVKYVEEERNAAIDVEAGS